MLPSSQPGQGSDVKVMDAPKVQDSLQAQFLAQMSKLEEINNTAVERGNHRLGWWIGPSTMTEGNPFVPVFVLAQPLEEKVPHAWVDNEDHGEAFELRHKYVVVTPDGPIAVCFRKRLVDASGERSEYHTGPGGERLSDYDDVEGGENNLLAVLNTGRRDHNGTGFGGDIGLIKTTEGKPLLVLGHPQLEHVNYAETQDEKSSWWWLQTEVKDEELQEALSKNIEKSNTKLPEDQDAIRRQRQERQSAIIKGSIGL